MLFGIRERAISTHNRPRDVLPINLQAESISWSDDLPLLNSICYRYAERPVARTVESRKWFRHQGSEMKPQRDRAAVGVFTVERGHRHPHIAAGIVYKQKPERQWHSLENRFRLKTELEIGGGLLVRPLRDGE
jgi:hypothetical protein